MGQHHKKKEILKELKELEIHENVLTQSLKSIANRRSYLQKELELIGVSSNSRRKVVDKTLEINIISSLT